MARTYIKSQRTSWPDRGVPMCEDHQRMQRLVGILLLQSDHEVPLSESLVFLQSRCHLGEVDRGFNAYRLQSCITQHCLLKLLPFALSAATMI